MSNIHEVLTPSSCPLGTGIDSSPYSGGGVLFSTNSQLGDSSGFDPKVGRAQYWGAGCRGRCSERGAETRHRSPAGRASPSCPCAPACGVPSLHLPMNLTGSGFSSLLPPRRAWGSCPNPSSAAVSATSRRALSKARSRSLPITAVGRFLASSAGTAPQQLLSHLVSSSWGLVLSHFLSADLPFLCSKEFSLPLIGQFPAIPIPANNSVY